MSEERLTEEARLREMSPQKLLDQLTRTCPILSFPDDYGELRAELLRRLRSVGTLEPDEPPKYPERIETNGACEGTFMRGDFCTSPEKCLSTGICQASLAAAIPPVPSATCQKCGKLVRKTPWIPALLGECDCETMPSLGAGEWVDVKKRLPEDGVGVLVWRNFGLIDDNDQVQWDVGWLDYDTMPAQWVIRGEVIDNITHWQPLPEPPK